MAEPEAPAAALAEIEDADIGFARGVAGSGAVELDQANIIRLLVPSEREVSTGEAVYTFNPAPPPPESVPFRQTVRTYLRQYLHDMNPGTLAKGTTIWPLLIFFWLGLFDQIDNAGTAVLLPDLRDHFNVDLTFIVGLAGAAVVVGFVFSPITGYLSDRFNRIWFARVGWLLRFIFGNILAGLTGNLALFATSRFLGPGLGAGMGLPMTAPLLRDIFRPSVLARVTAMAGLGGVIGATLGPAMYGQLDQYLGPLTTYVFIGVPGAFAAVLLFTFKEPGRGVQERAEYGITAIPDEEALPPVGETLRTLLGIQTVRRMLMAIPLVTAAGFSILFYMGLFYQQVYLLGPAQRGLYISLSNVGAIVGVLIYAPLADRLLATKPARLLAVLGACLCAEAIAVLVISLVQSAPLSAVIGIVPAFLSALFFPFITLILLRVIPVRMIGMGLTLIFPPIAFGVIIIIGLVFYSASIYGYRTGLQMFIPIDILAAFLIVKIGPFLEKDILSAVANTMALEESKRSKAAGRNKMIVIRHLDVFYDAAQVLFGLDLDVEEGEILALLGTNGAGKSTLLRAISGVHEATYGAVYLDGRDITHTPPHVIAKNGIVMMPGGRAVFPTMTVEENLQAAAYMYRADEDYLSERRQQVLDLFPSLGERLGTQAGNMSGGEQQMLGLGQALLMKPRVLMIDELSLGLTPQVVQQLLDALRQIHANGTTIIIVEQSVSVALSIAERAIYMEKGTIRFDGSTRDLLSRGDIVRSVFLGHAVTGSLGNSRRNVLDLGPDRETILEVSDIHLRYGGMSVLNGVSLTVDRGEVVGIVGPNGAGKTTLLDAIAGTAQVDEGSVSFLSTVVTRSSADSRARMGMARSFQNVRLFPALTVRENIAVALERHLENRSAVMAAVWSPITQRVERRVKRRVDNLIESLGLGAYGDKFVNELSTGTRRVVDIACVLAAQPRLLMLDEPSSGLAQAETEQLAPVIGRIVKETGCGLIVIEHDLGLIAAVSDRLVAMRLGAVMAEGTPAEVLDNRDVVDALLGGASEAVVSKST